jgi:hypothetical protein
MTAQPNSEIQRLSTVIEERLADLERRTKRGETPSIAELNGVRRLIEWVERERDFAEARALTSSPKSSRSA